jgi:hypothetical protein
MSLQPLYAIIIKPHNYDIRGFIANASLKISWLFHLPHFNKGPVAPTLHIPCMPHIIAQYQCLHLSPRLKHRSLSLIPFVPTS